MKRCSRIFALTVLGALVLLTDCSGSQSAFAPVEERSHSSVEAPDRYRIRTGDTLYSVAWAYHMDYRRLVELNHLSQPYTLHVGQVLQVKSGASFVKKAPAKKVNHVLVPVVAWHWPTQGKVVRKFSSKPLGNKGIDISGALRRPIYASASGIVVYSGQGIRGYGNLLIIKHNEDYLSAYAFNWRNLVKAGDTVNVGQPIAMMGRDDSGRVLLHFEIRCGGEPVDPLNYLS